MTLRMGWRVLVVVMAFSLAASVDTGAAQTTSRPTISSSSFTDQNLPQNGFLPPVLFTVGDDTTDPDALVVTASSSNQAIVPAANLVLAGSGSTRSISLTTAIGATGSTVITVSVADATETASASFTVNIATNKYYLAEGATGPFFDTDLLIGNPVLVGAGITPRSVHITFFKHDGTTVEHTRELASASRTTIRVDDIPGMEWTSFSTVVEALPIDTELAVERTMWWDQSRYGSHTEKASLGAAPTWYFAEGSQGAFFSTFLLLVNPQTAANNARVTWFREGEAPLVRLYPMAAGSRRTIFAAEDPELTNRSFGARVDFDLPGMAERAMYFGAQPAFSGGHGSAGATQPSRRWFLAEGSTGGIFTTFVLLANPGTDDAVAKMTYLLPGGSPIVRDVPVPAGRRVTLNVAGEHPALAAADVGVSIESTQPIVVERSQYWPGSPETWQEAHNTFGVTTAGQRWALAEGRVGGSSNDQTYILLANPGTTGASVRLQFHDVAGRIQGLPLTKTITVPPTSRKQIAIAGPGSDVPELENEEFTVIIDATEPIVVERAMYSNANGIVWAAGTVATAAPLRVRPPPLDAGPDQFGVALGSTVNLHALTNAETFQWTFISRPAGSNAVLANATTRDPSFVLDVPGDYIVEVTVRGEFVKSAPERVLVTTRAS
jgi:hypothetical protein